MRMHPSTLHGFLDEMEKLAKGQGLLTSANRSLKEVARDTGYAVASLRRPVKAVKDGWSAGHRHGMGWTWSKGRHAGKYLPGGKTLTVGFGAATAPEAFKKEDPTGQGRSRSERVGKWVGEQVGGLAGTRYGLTGGMAAGTAGSVAGETLGKAVGKAKKVLRSNEEY